MTLTKTYEINFIDLDSSFIEIAEDLKHGYTIQQIKQETMELCPYTVSYLPAFTITLRNKKVSR